MTGRVPSARVYPVEGGFVVADQAGWLPGVYATEEEALAAVRGRVPSCSCGHDDMHHTAYAQGGTTGCRLCDCAAFAGRGLSSEDGMSATEGRVATCGARLLWPESGYYQEHVCALPAGHEGRHHDQDDRWWPDQQPWEPTVDGWKAEVEAMSTPDLIASFGPVADSTHAPQPAAKGDYLAAGGEG